MQIIKRALDCIDDYRILYFPKNSIKPIIIDKKQYQLIKSRFDLYRDNIVREVIIEKGELKPFNTVPSILIDDFVVLSQIGDYLGPVIQYNDQYFRCIKTEAKKKFLDLWNSGILQVFERHGFIPSITISNYYTEDYPIILKMETIDILPFYEWTEEQSVRAALFISILQGICRRLDCVILAPHYFNITFVENRPIYFDIGSFYMTRNLEKYNDTSMVLLGLYRILFLYFNESVLSKQELGDFRWGKKKNDYSNKMHEFVLAKRRAMAYHRFHSTKTGNKAFRKIFLKNKCTPEDVAICFIGNEIIKQHDLIDYCLRGL